MEINSPLTGRRGVALPFSDFCFPLTDNEFANEIILNSLQERGQKRGWKYFEIRGPLDSETSFPVYETFLTHSLELSGSEDQILSGFRTSTRRNIKKAVKAGLKVEFSNSWQAMREFVHLNALTRRKHGLPPQPDRFFASLQSEILGKGGGEIALARTENQYIAGAVFLFSDKQVLYKYGASDNTFQQFRPNNLIFWEAIVRYLRLGYATLNFGRTHPNNSGLLQFKRGWGTRETKINYYRFDFSKNSFVQSTSSPAGNLSEKIFSCLPLPILKLTGNILYKHFG